MESIPELPPLPLEELIALMRLAGFWLNPNAHPDSRNAPANLTDLLQYRDLARCRILVQCNPNLKGNHIHKAMSWARSACGAQIRGVHHIPIIQGETFLNGAPMAEHRGWHYLRQIVHDTVELNPQQRWIRYYYLTVSFDGQHERLLRLVQLGCHALTACAFFFLPNKLAPERVVNLDLPGG